MKIFASVTGEGENKSNKIYIAISIFIVLILVIAIVFSGNRLIQAYVDDSVLINGWSENPDKRENGSQILGLEKWAGFYYENGQDSTYSTYLSVTTIKSLVMMDETDIKDKVVESIRNVEKDGLIIDNDSKISGRRILKDGRHETTYIVYNGTDASKSPSEQIKIIGEVWNCATSGTSIICIGVAQVTDNAHGSSEINTVHWEKVIRDEEGTFGTSGYMGEDGLIFNVVCH